MTTQTTTKTFFAAIDAFNAYTDTPAWRGYNDVAAIEAAVDEAEAEDAVAERAAVWAGVTATEAAYDAVFVKCDGREG